MMKRLCFLVLAAALVLPAVAFGFGGAHVLGGSAATNYAAHNAYPRVQCAGGTQSSPRRGDFGFCSGTISFSFHHRLAGSAPFSIRSSDVPTVPVPLKDWFRKYLNKHGSARVGVELAAHDGAGHFKTTKQSIRVHT